MALIDLHTHSFFSDGALIPSELVRRAEFVGYSCIAITDHVDISNIETVVPAIANVCRSLYGKLDTVAIPGAEISYVPPCDIKAIVRRARKLGAFVVGVHGETIAEYVAQGTNAAALDSDIDFLAHPGLLTLEQAKLAAEKKILLEITTRKGHSLTNGLIARLAEESGASLIINNDAHQPADLLPENKLANVALGSGMSMERFEEARQNAYNILQKYLHFIKEVE